MLVLVVVLAVLLVGTFGIFVFSGQARKKTEKGPVCLEERKKEAAWTQTMEAAIKEKMRLLANPCIERLLKTRGMFKVEGMLGETQREVHITRRGVRWYRPSYNGLSYCNSVMFDQDLGYEPISEYRDVECEYSISQMQMVLWFAEMLVDMISAQNGIEKVEPIQIEGEGEHMTAKIRYSLREIRRKSWM